MGSLKEKIKNNTYSLKGKTVAISGATGGLGRELCLLFCALGTSLILLDRNKARSEALIEELKARFDGVRAEHITLDLEDMERVWQVADELEARELDFLVLNAGAYSIPRHKCSTGFDNVYQINFVSPYCLARRLLPSIQARGGRVVAVGSVAHRYSHIDVNDFDFSTRSAASKVYGNAKRYLMFSLMGIEEYRENITVAHPGITVTNITSHYPKLVYAIIKYPMKVIFMSPKKACLPILCGLFEKCGENEWIGPSAFDVWGSPKRSTLSSCPPDEAKRICGIAEEIYEKLSEERSSL